MKDWRYTITEPMVRDLKLQGTELNLFAIIDGYSQKGDGCFYGHRAELAERCGVTSKRTIDKALQSLISKGLICKFNIIKDGRECVAYSAGAKNAPEGCKKCTGEVQKMHGGGAKNAPKNNKQEYKLEYIPTTSPQGEKQQPATFTPPTIQEVTQYAKERGFADPAGFADFFITICTNSGWRRAEGRGKPITNWKNYIVSCWERNRKNDIFSTAPSQSGRSFHEMTAEEFRQKLYR